MVCRDRLSSLVLHAMHAIDTYSTENLSRHLGPSPSDVSTKDWVQGSWSHVCTRTSTLYPSGSLVGTCTCFVAWARVETDLLFPVSSTGGCEPPPLSYNCQVISQPQLGAKSSPQNSASAKRKKKQRKKKGIIKDDRVMTLSHDVAPT